MGVALVTRAVYLEMVPDMSTISFIYCLRRFMAIKGTPEEIICDNAMQFKLASETTKLMWNVLNGEELQSYSSNKGIKWSFIVELAPWMGGFYERLVGLIKRSLRKAIGRKVLNSDQLHTVLKEAEAILNYRSLVYVGDDKNSSVTITPANFICLNPKTGIPESNDCHDNLKDENYNPYESSAEKILNLWHKGQKLLNNFWQIWRDEYLLSLRERTQNKIKCGRIQSGYEPNTGDVVLIKEDVPRGSWRLGKIVELKISNDNQIRSAKVKTPSGRIIGRPLKLLYPLEVSKQEDKQGPKETSFTK